MPFYEYECSDCKYYLEVLQKITDAPMTKCPSCGKDALHRLISAPVFRLKGSGWYETDFKSDKENKRNLVGSGSDDKEPAKSDSDDKKIKVRATKALKKVSAKQAAKKPGNKAGNKVGKAKPQVKAKAKAKPQTKTAAKSGSAAKKDPVSKAKKPTAKTVRKTVRQPAKKAARKAAKKK